MKESALVGIAEFVSLTRQPSYLRSSACICGYFSFAACIVVRPLELYGVIPKLLGLPGADITDLAVVIVVPTLARYWISDRFTEFVRTGRGQSVQVSHPA